MTGEYRVKKADLRLLHQQARAALQGFERWSIRSVPREQNELADELVNEAIDARAPTAELSSQPPALDSTLGAPREQGAGV